MFIPKKTITVQLTLEMWQKFEKIRAALGLTKTQMIEKMIQEAEKEQEERV